MSQLEDSESDDDEDECPMTSDVHRNTRPRMEEVQSDDDEAKQPPQKKEKEIEKGQERQAVIQYNYDYLCSLKQ